MLNEDREISSFIKKMIRGKVPALFPEQGQIFKVVENLKTPKYKRVIVTDKLGNFVYQRIDIPVTGVDSSKITVNIVLENKQYVLVVDVDEKLSSQQCDPAQNYIDTVISKEESVISSEFSSVDDLENIYPIRIPIIGNDICPEDTKSFYASGIVSVVLLYKAPKMKKVKIDVIK